MIPSHGIKTKENGTVARELLIGAYDGKATDSPYFGITLFAPVPRLPPSTNWKTGFQLSLIKEVWTLFAISIEQKLALHGRTCLPLESMTASADRGRALSSFIFRAEVAFLR